MKSTSPTKRCHWQLNLQGFNYLQPNSVEVSGATALLMAQRRGRIKASELERLVAELEVLPIEAESPIGTGRVSAVIALAKSHSLTTYDATYLELAQRRNVAIATLDTRLGAASKAQKVVVLP